MTAKKFESMYKVRKIIDDMCNLILQVRDLKQDEYDLLIKALEEAVQRMEVKK